MIVYSGKVGVGQSGPTIVKWPVTSETFYDGTLVSTPTNLAAVTTADVDVFGIASKIVAADTTGTVTLTPLGSILSCDFGLDELDEGGTGTAGTFTDASCIGGTDDMFVGASLLIVSDAGTPANVGTKYPITAYTSSSGVFTATGMPAMHSGDKVRIVDIELTGTALIGKTLFGFGTHATKGSYITADGTWATTGQYTYGIIIGVQKSNKILVALTDTVL